MTNGHLSEAQKKQLYKLIDKGATVRQIESIMGVSRQTVTYWRQVRDGTVIRTKDKYPLHHRPKPSKRYVDYLWEGYQRDHDPGVLAFIQYRYPKFYSEKMNVNLYHNQKYANITLI